MNNTWQQRIGEVRAAGLQLALAWRLNCTILQVLRACSKSGILALQTPKFYLAGSKRARKSGFLWSIGRKNPQFEQALMAAIANQEMPKHPFVERA
jgi:hypothetical protein